MIKEYKSSVRSDPFQLLSINFTGNKYFNNILILYYDVI